MLIFTAAFYRRGDTVPFHTWAAFSDHTLGDALRTVEMSVSMARTGGGLLEPTYRYVVGDQYHRTSVTTELIDSPEEDVDEQIGDFLRRGNRWWIAPPGTIILPDVGVDPGPPWIPVNVTLTDSL